MDRIRKRDIEQEIMLKLNKMKDLVYTSSTQKVISDVRDKDIVLFVGNTRCGKSTIVNQVIGNVLVANKKKIGKLFLIAKQDPLSPGPAIGLGSSSETTIPTAWPSSKISGVVVDAPGFDDNRGEAQDVANSFYVAEIIKNARSVKLALISDIADIKNDNIIQFTNFIDKILTMIPHRGQMHKGMVMIFNKDNENYTREDINMLFKEKITDQPIIQINNRQLVSYLYNNPTQVVIVRMPTKAGPIDGSDVFGDLIDVIEKSAIGIPKHEMSAIVPGISDKSRGFLLEAHRYFTEMKEFDDVLKMAFDEFMKSLSKFDIAKNSRSSAEALALKREIFALENNVKAVRDNKVPFFDKLKLLKTLVPNVKQLDENSEMTLKLKFVAFVDVVLKIKESNIFNIKINAIISHMLDLTSQARINLQEKMMEISQEEANRKIQEISTAHEQSSKALANQINELKQQNQRLMDQQKQELGLFGRIGSFIDSVFG